MDAAGELFLRNGYASTTMDDIATAASISRKSLFLYFPAKGDLIWHRAAPYGENLHGDLEHFMASRGDLGEAVVAAIVAGYRNAPNAERTARALIHLYVTDAAVRELVERHGAPWRKIIADAAEKAGASALIADVIAYGFWRAMWLGMEEWELHGDDIAVAVIPELRRFASTVPTLMGS